MWAEFTYDAYGLPQLHVPGAPDNTLAQAVQSSIGLMLTPQLYRGYVYAAVGEMYTYYLGSRFYSPQLGRFLNADKHIDTGTGVIGTNMFAYCDNNPVMHVDPNGEALKGISSLLSSFSRFVLGIVSFFSNWTPLSLSAKVIAKNNYEYNKQIENNYSFNYIYGQGNKPLCDMRVGTALLSSVGCEIVATYNALVLANKKVSLSKIILDFENNGLVMATGQFGSNPNRIDKYLKLIGIEYKKYNSLEKLNQSLTQSECIILSFWNEKITQGLHTIAILKGNDDFFVFNYFNSDKEIKHFSSILDMIKSESKYIVAYTIPLGW